MLKKKKKASPHARSACDEASFIIIFLRILSVQNSCGSSSELNINITYLNIHHISNLYIKKNGKIFYEFGIFLTERYMT